MNPKVALAQLKAITDLVGRTTSQLVGTATSFSAQSTEIVLSVFGGALAAALAYIVSILDARFSFPVLGTLATLVGLTGGILAVRFLGLRESGRDRLRRSIELNRETDRYLRAAYLALPRRAVAERQELLELIVENYRKLVALSAPASGEESFRKTNRRTDRPAYSRLPLAGQAM